MDSSDALGGGDGGALHPAALGSEAGDRESALQINSAGFQRMVEAIGSAGGL